jgi:hypothetical protein
MDSPARFAYLFCFVLLLCSRGEVPIVYFMFGFGFLCFLSRTFLDRFLFYYSFVVYAHRRPHTEVGRASVAPEVRQPAVPPRDTGRQRPRTALTRRRLGSCIVFRASYLLYASVVSQQAPLTRSASSRSTYTSTEGPSATDC